MKIPPTPFTTTELFEFNGQEYDHRMTKDIAKKLRSMGYEKWPTRHNGSVRDCWHLSTAKARPPIDRTWIYKEE